MIAFRPACALKAEGFEHDVEYWQKQCQPRVAVEFEYRDVSTHPDRVGGQRMARGGFRFHAQVVVARRHAGNNHGVAAAAFGPRTVAVASRVVTDFTAEIPGA